MYNYFYFTPPPLTEIFPSIFVNPASLIINKLALNTNNDISSNNSIDEDIINRRIDRLNVNVEKLSKLTIRDIMRNAQYFHFVCLYSDQQKAADKFKISLNTDDMLEFEKWIFSELSYIGTPLEIAVEHKNIPIVKQLIFLLKQVATRYDDLNLCNIMANKSDIFIDSLFSEVIKNGDLELFKELQLFFNESILKANLWLFISTAYESSKFNILSYVQKLYTVDATEISHKYFEQKIFHAVNNDRGEIVEMLLQHGANPAQEYNYNYNFNWFSYGPRTINRLFFMTPDHYIYCENIVQLAIKKNNITILEQLVKYGANLNKTIPFNVKDFQSIEAVINSTSLLYIRSYSLLEYAIQHSNINTIIWLLYNGAKTVYFDSSFSKGIPQSSPLHEATRINNPIIVALLLATKASSRDDIAFTKDINKLTAWQYAKKLTDGKDRSVIISMLESPASLLTLSLESLVLDFFNTNSLYVDANKKNILFSLTLPNNIQYFNKIITTIINYNNRGAIEKYHINNSSYAKLKITYNLSIT